MNKNLKNITIIGLIFVVVSLGFVNSVAAETEGLLGHYVEEAVVGNTPVAIRPEIENYPSNTSEASQYTNVFSDEGRYTKLNSREVSGWTMDLTLLPKHLQEMFYNPEAISHSALNELEDELLSTADRRYHDFIKRCMDRARHYYTTRNAEQTNTVLRAMARGAGAIGLREYEVQANFQHEKATGPEITFPYMPGRTIKMGYPYCEVYVGSSKEYEKGGKYFGQDPILIDSNILAMTGTTMATTAFGAGLAAQCPRVAAAMAAYFTGKSVWNVTEATYAITHTRQLALQKYGLTEEQFLELFEEEVEFDYLNADTGTIASAKYTLRLKNRPDVEPYTVELNFSDVVAVSTAVASAVDGFRRTLHERANALLRNSNTGQAAGSTPNATAKSSTGSAKNKKSWERPRDSKGRFTKSKNKSNVKTKKSKSNSGRKNSRQKRKQKRQNKSSQDDDEDLTNFRARTDGNRVIRAEARHTGRHPNRTKGSRPDPLAGHRRGHHRGHLVPENTVDNPNAVNVPENFISETQTSNLGDKRRFENLLADIADANPNSVVQSVHFPKYRPGSDHPYAVSHWIKVDGKTVYGLTVLNQN